MGLLASSDEQYNCFFLLSHSSLAAAYVSLKQSPFTGDIIFVFFSYVFPKTLPLVEKQLSAFSEWSLGFHFTWFYDLKYNSFPNQRIFSLIYLSKQILNWKDNGFQLPF